MSYKSICISSGHGKYVKGADGTALGGCDEVTEARRVVDHLADELGARGVAVTVFHDNTSKDQGTNLNTIVNAHNKSKRELDCSVHFNAFDGKAHGVEVCYLSQKNLAAEVSAAIASVGLTNRGPKHRTDLKFLNATNMPAILIETAFCDNAKDIDLYMAAFDLIVENIADVLGGELSAGAKPPTEEIDAPPLLDEALFHAIGKCSHFGGPDDTGVSPSEGLAFIYSIDDAPQLFLPFQPEGSSGLARRLNPYIHYLAARWNYSVTPKPSLLEDLALVRNTKTGLALTAFPADWGPNENTGRVADLSPGLMDDLGLVTDDEVEVIYPWRPTE